MDRVDNMGSSKAVDRTVHFLIIPLVHLQQMDLQKRIYVRQNRQTQLVFSAFGFSSFSSTLAYTTYYAWLITLEWAYSLDQEETFLKDPFYKN
jgi:hypothetical protein